MEKTHSLIMGINDPLAAAHTRRQIEDHDRFELMAVADNAVQTLQLIELHKPSVALLADTSPGLRGREVLADIAASSPNTLVIITTPGDPAALAGQPAVAESLAEADTRAVVNALDSLADFLDNPLADDLPDRRRVPDRRLIQDWTQVFAERRVTVRRSS